MLISLEWMNGRKYRAPEDEGGEGGAAVADTPVEETPESTESEPEEESGPYDFVDEDSQHGFNFPNVHDQDEEDSEAGEETNEDTDSEEEDVSGESADATPAGEEARQDLGQQALVNELLYRANQMGFTPEQVANFGSPQALQAAVVHAEQQAVAWQEYTAQQNQPEQPQVTVENFLQGVNEEELLEAGYDQAMVDREKARDLHYAQIAYQNHLNTQQMQYQFNQQVSQLHQQLNGLNQHAEAQRQAALQQQVQERMNRFDQQINSLGEEYESLFGKGTVNEIDHASSHFSNRDAVYRKMDVLAAGYQSSGMKVPPENALFEEALHSTFANHQKNLAAAEAKSKAEKQRKRSSPRPTQRSTEPLKGIEAAKARIAEFEDKHAEAFG